MPSRNERARIAAETVAILDRGSYITPSGRVVDIRDAVARARAEAVLVTPAEQESLRVQAQRVLSNRSHRTVFEVANETTLSAARRVTARVGADRTAALNFASAKHPGGGFLSGAQAQEESLTRASALYASLLRHRGYYEANQHCGTLLYTNHLIVSPHVPVFRDDDDTLLEEPWQVTIITSPAPNAGAIADTEPESLAAVEPTFRRRIEMVLSGALAFNQEAIVLGAWGCGVFRNDPALVARLFGEFLLANGPFSNAFSHVIFAVLDRRGDTIAPFRQVFIN
jgi:uncharacterized protein (TIGR02452 family)